MTKELSSLLKEHGFLDAALQQHGDRMSRLEAEKLADERDQLFIDILYHKSNDASITLAQIEFLLSQSISLASDGDKAEALQDACNRHIEALSEQLKTAPHLTPPPALPSPSSDFTYFDSMSDHVAVFDRNYQYVFTNKANADFLGERASDFVGRPNWAMLGEKFFEAVSKPRYDACLAGQHLSYISRHPAADPLMLFNVSLDPIRDPCGKVNGFMVSGRDISELPIPAELVVPLPR